VRVINTKPPRSLCPPGTEASVSAWWVVARSLYVSIYKVGLCPSRGVINRLMMTVNGYH
jgi:hypothetical protein